VYSRLPKACRDTDTDLAAATEAYETVHRPLLRLVAIGALMQDDPALTSNVSRRVGPALGNAAMRAGELFDRRDAA
jgi:hypothetical protein